MHWLILQLKTPVRSRRGGWTADGDALVPMEMGTRWTGHSARHCLPSWAAALGIDAERRAFIGRWKAGVDVDLNTYVLTARQVVHGVQEEVLRSFCTGKPKSYVEVELFEEMVKHAEARQLDGKLFVSGHMIWRRRDRAVALFQDFPMIEDVAWERWEDMQGGRDGKTIPLVAAEESAEAAPYLVSISRKTGFRRLRKTNGCGIKPESVHRSEPVVTINSKVADKKCQICWCQKPTETSTMESSSESSSSTESESDLASELEDGYEKL